MRTVSLSMPSRSAMLEPPRSLLTISLTRAPPDPAPTDVIVTSMRPPCSVECVREQRDEGVRDGRRSTVK